MGRIRTDRERAELEAEHARLIRDALAAAEPTAGMRPRSSEGDTRRLRGLPAIAPGVRGCIPGTDPLAAVLAAEARASRSRRAHPVED